MNALRHAFTAAALAATLAAPAAASAAVISGTITDNNSQGGYMGELTNIQVVSGSAKVPETAFVFCIDLYADYPDAGTTQYFDLSDSLAGVMTNSGVADKATGLVHYAVDHYLGPLLNGGFGEDAGIDLNLAMWRLTDKFDGSLASLGMPQGDSLFATMMSDLRDNFYSIDASYRSSQYTIQYLYNLDSTYQTLAMVTARDFGPESGNEVPEPSSMALILTGGLGFVLHARRRRQQLAA